MKASFSRLDSRRWGVRVDADLGGPAARMSGKEVEVTKRDGSTKTVRLGRMISQWNGGRAAQYEIAPAPREARPQVQAPQFDVPAGKYAIPRDGEVQFFSVDRPTRGRWAGYIFVARLVGDNHEPYRSREQRNEILELISKDVLGALQLYGRSTNTCGACSMRLTDKFSRFMGVGPVCRRQRGMVISEAAYVRDGGVLPPEYLNEAEDAQQAFVVEADRTQTIRDDRENLIARAREGDEEAFELLQEIGVTEEQVLSF